MLPVRSTFRLALGILVLLALAAPTALGQGTLVLDPVGGPVEGWTTVELVGIYTNEGNSPNFDVALEGEILLDGVPFATVTDRGPLVEPGKAVQFTVPVELGEPGTYEARLWVVADGAATEPGEITFTAEGGTPPPPAESGFPWMWIVAGALILLVAGGAGAFVVVKKRQAAVRAAKKKAAKKSSKGKPAQAKKAKAKAKAAPTATQEKKPAKTVKAKAKKKAAAKRPAAEGEDAPKKQKPGPVAALLARFTKPPVKAAKATKAAPGTKPAKAAAATKASSKGLGGFMNRVADAKPQIRETAPATEPPQAGEKAPTEPKAAPKPAPKRKGPPKPAEVYAKQIAKAFQDLNTSLGTAIPAPTTAVEPEITAAPRDELDDRLDAMLARMQELFPDAAGRGPASAPAAPAAATAAPPAPSTPAGHDKPAPIRRPPATEGPSAPEGKSVVPVRRPDPVDGNRDARTVVRIKNAPVPEVNPLADDGKSSRVVTIQPKNAEPKAHKLGETGQQVYRPRDD